MIVVRTVPGILKQIYDELGVAFTLPADFSAYLIAEKAWDAKGFRRDDFAWTPKPRDATNFMSIDDGKNALLRAGGGRPERYEVVEL